MSARFHAHDRTPRWRALVRPRPRACHNSSPGHGGTIPKRSVLLFQEKQAPHPVEARPEPGRVEMHEGEQGEGLRDRADRMVREERGQPDGFVAQLAADRLLRARGKVSFVEK